MTEKKKYTGKKKIYACLLIIVVAAFLFIQRDVVEETQVVVEEYEEENDFLRFVSGTEYVPGQEGQVAILIVNAAGDVVTTEYNCSFEVLFPDKVEFVSGNFTENTSIGTYYTNFTIPNIEGVYEYAAECVKGGKVAFAGKSFHVTKKKIRAVVVK